MLLMGPCPLVIDKLRYSTRKFAYIDCWYRNIFTDRGLRIPLHTKAPFQAAGFVSLSLAHGGIEHRASPALAVKRHSDDDFKANCTWMPCGTTTTATAIGWFDISKSDLHRSS